MINRQDKPTLSQFYIHAVLQAAKESGGCNRSGSGRGVKDTNVSSVGRGEIGDRGVSGRKPSEKAKNALRTRKQEGGRRKVA